MLKKITNYLLFISGFLLWWQARLIISDDYVNGAPFEMGRVSLYISQIIIFSTSFVLLWQWFKAGKKLLLNNKWYLIFAVLIIYLTLQTIILNNSLLGYFILGQWLLLLLFLFSLLHSDFESHKHKLIAGFILGGLMLALWVWWQWFAQYQFASTWLGVAEHLPAQPGTAVILNGNDRIMRAYGGLPHPNILGGYLVLVILLFTNYRKKLFSEKFLRWENVLTSFLVGALMLTFSRSAIFGLIIGLLLLVGQTQYIKNNFKILLTMFLTIVFVFVVYNNLYLSRFTANNYLENKSTSERLSGYGAFQKDIGGNWVFGLGFAGYQKKLIDNNTSLNGYEIQPIHNSWLFLLAQVGLVGLLLVFSLFYYSSLNKFVILAIIVIGLFDHYFVSLFVGQLLLVTSFIKLDKN